MLGGNNNINSNNDNKKDANRSTHKSNNTQPLPRVQRRRRQRSHNVPLAQQKVVIQPTIVLHTTPDPRLAPLAK